MSRVLPPQLFFLTLAACLAIWLLLPAWPALAGIRWLGLPLFLAGLALMLVAHGNFVRVATTIHPRQPPKTLVTDGPFRWSRNPMYLGMVIMTLGAGLMTASPWGLLPALGLFAILDRAFIPTEEANAAAAFGADYAAYRTRVRRWL